MCVVLLDFDATLVVEIGFGHFFNNGLGHIYCVTSLHGHERNQLQQSRLKSNLLEHGLYRQELTQQ